MVNLGESQNAALDGVRPSSSKDLVEIQGLLSHYPNSAREKSEREKALKTFKLIKKNKKIIHPNSPPVSENQPEALRVPLF